MAIRTAVNRALTAITALPTAAALTDGNFTLLTTATASSSATLNFMNKHLNFKVLLILELVMVFQ